MKRTTRLAPIAVAIALAIAAVSVTAAVAGGDDGPATAADHPARSGPAGRAGPAYQPDAETKLVGLTPCRIVDTRTGTGVNGTPFNSRDTRTYYVGGTTGFPAQGGKSGGCGVPVGATSINITITAVNATHSGYLRVWPNGSAEPTSTVMNYFAPGSTSTGTTVAINDSSAYALKVRNYNGPTDVVVDVTGYYVKPMAAFISPSGSPYSGSSRVLGGTKTGTGVYEVQFDRNVRYCTATATVYVSSYYASASTWFDSTRPDTVRINVFDASGAPVDQYVYVHVDC